MPRPSKTEKWPNTSNITIHLKESDITGHYPTNDKGCVNTNKRSFNNLTATVICGNPMIFEDRIEIDENSQIWECIINNVGALSSIGYDMKNQEVVVIIHNK
jgi:hypothetical protein